MKMNYIFGEAIYDTANGGKYKSPSIIQIENYERYGLFFWAEITNLKQVDYVEEIVEEIEKVLSGAIDVYDGFGFEVYNIVCDREKAVVENLYDDTIEAIIPVQEVYELMRDWRDFLQEYYAKQKK